MQALRVLFLYKLHTPRASFLHCLCASARSFSPVKRGEEAHQASMASFTATLSGRAPASAQLASPSPQIKGLGKYNGLRCCQMPKKHFSLQVQRRASSQPLQISCKSTIEQVQDIIATQLSVDRASVQPQTKFSELGADSLDTVEIVMSLEEKFGVSIGEQDAENISTVQQVADLLDKQNAAS